MPTETIGDFKLDADKLIGKGAWGEVYQGRQISLDRPVAIKILKKELTEDQSFVSRFLREANCLAKLTNEHIIQVYGAGKYRGSHYFAMEYVQGLPLQKFISHRKKFSTDEIIHVAMSVARALKSAWESPEKIIHRDIKPSNIMISFPSEDQKGNQALLDSNLQKATIKVMDFGLAKRTKSEDDATVVGTVIGTPKYISPEQGMGQPADIRSDIYSLGIVLYEMITGKIPFKSDTVESMVRHHIYDTPTAPSRVNNQISVGLETVIMKCLQKEPAQRYHGPAELLEDLDAVKQNNKLIHASPDQSTSSFEATMISGTKKPSTRKSLITAVILLAFITAAGWAVLTGKLKTNPTPPVNANNQGTDSITNMVPDTTSPIIFRPSSQPTASSIVQQGLDAFAPLSADEKKFKIDLWTNKKTGEVYHKGDKVKFFFRPNRDSYVYLYHMDAAGNVNLIFPNKYSQKNFIEADKTYAIPDDKMNFEFEAEEPFGVEMVKIVASLQPLEEIKIDNAEAFKKIGNVANSDVKKIITRGLATKPKEDYTEASYEIKTVAQPADK